jgi:hypothetical protein
VVWIRTGNSFVDLVILIFLLHKIRNPAILLKKCETDTGTQKFAILTPLVTDRKYQINFKTQFCGASSSFAPPAAPAPTLICNGTYLTFLHQTQFKIRVGTIFSSDFYDFSYYKSAREK